MNVVKQMSVLATTVLGVVFAGNFCPADTVGCRDAACDEVRVDAFGFDPADATGAFRKAVQSGARRVIVPRKEGPWFVTPLSFTGLDGVEIVFEDGAEVCAKRGAFLGRTDSLLTFRCSSNVTIRGRGTVRMWKGDYVKPPYEKAEWRHALAILACRNVTIEDLSIVESGGDAIYISTVDRPAPGFRRYSENVVVRNVKCLRNHRQGISVIAADGLLVEGCELSDTCGTSPQAGIDFEPNVPGDTIANCVMRNCLLERNRGFGVDTLFTWHDETTAPLDITIEHCISRDNEKAFHYNGVAQNGNLRTNRGRIVVTNCIARETGGSDTPYSHALEWGKAVNLPDGSILRPTELRDWDPSRLAVTDRRPGEMVRLSPAPLRYKANYLLYAAEAGEVRFAAKQVPVGKNGRAKPAAAQMVLSDLNGGKVAEIPAPAQTSTVCVARVPAKGVYRLTWNCGWGASLVLTESAVPVAVSMFAERDRIGRWMAPFMYGQDSTTAYFAVPEATPKFVAAGSGLGGGVGQSARTRVTDPSGRVVYDCDDMGYGDAYVSPDNPPAGLWKIEVLKPTKAYFNNYGFDVAGVPPLFFLSDEKYWTSR